MPGGRRGRTAVTLLCAALAIALACFWGGVFQSAGSARTAYGSAAAPGHEQLRAPAYIAYRSVPASTQARSRKGSSSAAVVAARRPTRYGIAFFGDSVSVGFGASDHRNGYIARVSRWLKAHGKRVVETVHAEGGVPVAHWAYAPIPTKLRAAIVELGTNDVRLGTSSGRFAQEYRTLMSRIRAANPKAQVLCLSVWSRREGGAFEGVINAQIRAVCPGTYVDITRLRDQPNIRSSDGFHPNDVGYRLIAQAVESKLKTG